MRGGGARTRSGGKNGAVAGRRRARTPVGALIPRKTQLVGGWDSRQPTTGGSNSRRILRGSLDRAEPGLAQSAVATLSGGQEQSRSGVDDHHRVHLGRKPPGPRDVAVILVLLASAGRPGQAFGFLGLDGRIARLAATVQPDRIAGRVSAQVGPGPAQFLDFFGPLIFSWSRNQVVGQFGARFFLGWFFPGRVWLT